MNDHSADFNHSFRSVSTGSSAALPYITHVRHGVYPAVAKAPFHVGICFSDYESTTDLFGL